MTIVTQKFCPWREQLQYVSDYGILLLGMKIHILWIIECMGNMELVHMTITALINVSFR